MTATIQERRVNVWRDQVQPRVLQAGSGPPLVFLHGPWGLLWDEFLDGLEAIPASERQKMSLKTAMLRVLQKKYPCRR